MFRVVDFSVNEMCVVLVLLKVNPRAQFPRKDVKEMTFSFLGVLMNG
jgi:hypothetical protein